MSVTLRPITRETLDEILALTVAPEQSSFVATNAYSLAQAAVIPQYQPFGIYSDEKPVGFAMFGFDEEEDAFCINRLMIDHAQQGKGYGREALRLIVEAIRTQTPKRGVIYLCFKPQNIVARTLYQQFGFVPDNREEGGQPIYRYAL